MPNIAVVKVEPVFEGGPKLWQVSLKWDADEVLSAHGETLAQALTRLTKQIGRRETMALQDVALRRGEQ